ncbi:MAG: PTS transporter subunit EIIC [Bowdeniella nasicola]|nr:PTS transporter subunit EIIC [Bowdeniella nasicola]
MTATKKSGSGFALAQRLGRSLMLPIATLPVAGLLNRFGAADVLGADGVSKLSGFHWVQPIADVFAAAGGTIFGHLPLLFAVGVAIGFARRSDGSTALAAVIGYITYEAVTAANTPFARQFGAGGEIREEHTINYGVLAGILIGILAAVLYQKYYRIKLPPYLAFFGGRRFVPIITAFASIILAFALAVVYPAFNWAINEQLGGWLMNAGTEAGFMGAFVGLVFGIINRLLIPFGLHHLLNSIPWFQIGSCTNTDGETFHGDIGCFFNGTGLDEAGVMSGQWTGSFMTGFFPIMMFALPAAGYAFYRTARPENRKAIGGAMVAVGLTAFLTGITEPIEFAFAYAAFPLYAVHAVLTGTSLFITNLLGIKLGFNFSAGATDYLLSFGRGAQYSGGAWKVLLLIVIGLVYAAIYYVLVTFLIKKFDFPTPGREKDGEGGDLISSIADDGGEAERKAEAKARAKK